ncbi:hypothetical protein ACQP25_17020 [Microtetraspora malaysiensis]|uniref:hypothetical protein n=1 Tax=Microtetraspora malaysiensis TaxID=161358 RepID=UPI003D946DF5
MTLDRELYGFRGVTPTWIVVDEVHHLTDTDWRRLTRRLTRALCKTPWPQASHVKTRYHQRHR